MLMKVRVRWPSMPWATRRVWATPSSSDCTVRRAVSRKAAPAGVNATLRGVRSNNGAPTAPSSLRMAWLSGGCAMCSRSAARLKCSSSATAMNCWSRRVSITETPDLLNAGIEGVQHTKSLRCPERASRRLLEGLVMMLLLVSDARRGAGQRYFVASRAVASASISSRRCASIQASPAARAWASSSLFCRSFSWYCAHTSGVIVSSR